MPKKSGKTCVKTTFGKTQYFVGRSAFFGVSNTAFDDVAKTVKNLSNIKNLLSWGTSWKASLLKKDKLLSKK